MQTILIPRFFIAALWGVEIVVGKGQCAQGFTTVCIKVHNVCHHHRSSAL